MTERKKQENKKPSKTQPPVLHMYTKIKPNGGMNDTSLPGTLDKDFTPPTPRFPQI